MTDLKDSNADDGTPNHGRDGGSDGDLDAQWAAFEAEHRQDLDDVAGSSSARKFERHAQRQEKERLLNVSDLRADAFAHGNAGAGTGGPRDFTSSSWLDADDVMGDDFTPPTPRIGPVRATTVLFWALLVVGVAGLIASVFVPALTGILGSVFGLCALLGAAGLIIRHRGHSQTRTSPFDDGARV